MAPTILEMQQSIQRFGLDRLDQRFRERLRTLAPVIDLDFPNKLTRDPRNFSDAYHFNSKVARSIVGEVMRVKGVSETQANLIAKKGPKLTCPKIGPSVVAERSSDFLEGKSCRIWVQKENG